MKAFARLYEKLDSTTSTNAKVQEMERYFRNTRPADAVWALFFLSGRRLKRVVTSAKLRGWLKEVSPLPEWLIQESISAVGDTAEAVSLLTEGLGEPQNDLSLSDWMRDKILPLKGLDEEEQRKRVTGFWKELSGSERFILNKVLTGGLRVGVSKQLASKALGKALDIPQEDLLLKLMGDWEPSEAFFSSLSEEGGAAGLRPYPFYLASPLDRPLEELGDIGNWLAEWKWDGIRCQAVKREGEAALWSRSGDLITEAFPDVIADIEAIPGSFVLDGELVVAEDGKPRPFAYLQVRLGRKKVAPKLLKSHPAALLAYDLLEQDGADLRKEPLKERRRALEGLIARSGVHLSRPIPLRGWKEAEKLRKNARQDEREGLMLKELHSAYQTGRVKGEWWKYKVDPLEIDAVMIYAQPGSGRRSNLYTDYTFAVWDQGALVPVAKAYSGLTQEEIYELDRWIRQNTVERFGPVRSVKPEQVFELHFEAVNPSKRHKSGVAVRFPRISRWRKDKAAGEAGTLEELKALL